MTSSAMHTRQARAASLSFHNLTAIQWTALLKRVVVTARTSRAPSRASESSPTALPMASLPLSATRARSTLRRSSSLQEWLHSPHSSPFASSVAMGQPSSLRTASKRPLPSGQTSSTSPSDPRTASRVGLNRPRSTPPRRPARPSSSPQETRVISHSSSVHHRRKTVPSRSRLSMTEHRTQEQQLRFAAIIPPIPMSRQAEPLWHS